MSYVAINVLTVPDGAGSTLEQRFAARQGAVDSAPGFEHFELLRPLAGTEDYLVYTRWRSEEDFQNWMAGPMRAAHQGGGQRPAAADSSVWSFEVIQQTGPKAE